MCVSLLAFAWISSAAIAQGKPSPRALDLKMGAGAAFEEMDEVVVLFVKDAVTGLPLEGATLQIDGEDEYESDEKGRARVPLSTLQGAADQNLCLTVERSGYVPRRTSLEVRVGTVFKTELRLQPGAGGAPERCKKDIVEAMAPVAAPKDGEQRKGAVESQRPPSIDIPVLFRVNEAVLMEQGEAQCAELASALGEVLRLDKSARFRLIGHTDLRGTREHNQRLSEARVKEVQRVLIQKVPALGPAITEVFGRGMDEPKNRGLTEADHAQNRRVEVRRY